MVYIKRRSFRRRPKDILTLALKGLWPGDELFCTARTYEATKDRLGTFTQSWPDRKIAAIPAEGIMKLRRVA
jgi:hypothetical protein